MKWLINFTILFLLTSCIAHQAQTTQAAAPTLPITPAAPNSFTPTCRPTLVDGVSPSYQPNPPEHTVVGNGHVSTGVVLSGKDCQPIAHAKLEFWPGEPGRGHPNSSRATLFTDQDGRYRF